ncbi:SRPBCC family protein [Demequina sp.]|uniref:SRPBCC family protein n=1 Tax=Demequina sp. TaxID=2050685 RepID=UPI0025BDEC97|nr:SRPBCC family protein [Demequina sp.]
MITFTNTLIIDRPVSEVYQYLSDLEHIPEWNWAVETTTKTSPGPVRVGATYRQTRAIPRPAVEMLTVTALDEPRRIEVRGTLAGLPARLDYALAEDSGATRLVNAVELETPGTPRLFAQLLGDRIKKSVAQNLRALKETIERAHSRAV